MGEEIDREIYRFINSTEHEAMAELPDFDFEATRDALQTVPLPQQTADIIGAFGDHADVGLAATRLVDRVQTYLVGKVPHRVHQSLAGPIQEMPAHSDVARFSCGCSSAIASRTAASSSTSPAPRDWPGRWPCRPK